MKEAGEVRRFGKEAGKVLRTSKEQLLKEVLMVDRLNRILKVNYSIAVEA